MWAKAMYVGKRPYKREERTTEAGDVIPAMKGMQYLFYTADWTNTGFIDGMGKTRFETIEEKDVPEYEKQLPALGGFGQVKIKESWGDKPNNLCEFIKRE